MGGTLTIFCGPAIPECSLTGARGVAGGGGKEIVLSSLTPATPLVTPITATAGDPKLSLPLSGDTPVGATTGAGFEYSTSGVAAATVFDALVGLRVAGGSGTSCGTTMAASVGV